MHQFLIRQLEGQYKVKSENIKPLFMEAMELLRQFQSYDLEHVRREFNKEADELANIALNKAGY